MAMQTVLHSGAPDLRPAPPLGIALVGPRYILFWLRLPIWLDRTVSNA